MRLQLIVWPVFLDINRVAVPVPIYQLLHLHVFKCISVFICNCVHFSCKLVFRFSGLVALGISVSMWTVSREYTHQDECSDFKCGWDLVLYLRPGRDRSIKRTSVKRWKSETEKILPQSLKKQAHVDSFLRLPWRCELSPNC